MTKGEIKMSGFLDFQIPHYTPQEINSMKAEIDRRQTQGLMDLNAMNFGSNLAQNLNPSSSFGFLLGNIGGRMLNNYFDNQTANRIRAAENQRLSQNLGQWAQNNLPNWARQNQPPQNQAWKFPANSQYLANPNQYDFSSYANVPSMRWQPSNNLLRW